MADEEGLEAVPPVLPEGARWHQARSLHRTPAASRGHWLQVAQPNAAGSAFSVQARQERNCDVQGVYHGR